MSVFLLILCLVLSYFNKKWRFPGMGALACNPNPQGDEARGLPWIWSQPGLHIKFKWQPQLHGKTCAKQHFHTWSFMLLCIPPLVVKLLERVFHHQATGTWFSSHRLLFLFTHLVMPMRFLSNRSISSSMKTKQYSPSNTLELWTRLFGGGG